MTLLLTAGASSAHRITYLEQLQVCPGSLSTSATVDEIFGGSLSEVNLEISYQKPNGTPVNSTLFTFNVNDVGVGNQVPGLDDIALPTPIRMDLSEALTSGNVGLPVTLSFRGTTLGAPDTFGQASGGLMACDTVRFTQSSLSVVAGTDFSLQVKRETLEPTKQSTMVTVLGTDAGSCSDGDAFEFVDATLLRPLAVEVVFPSAGTETVQMRSCPQFLGETQVVLENGSPPSVIIQPARVDITITSSSAEEETVLLHRSDLTLVPSNPMRGFFSDAGHAIFVNVGQGGVSENPRQRRLTRTHTAMLGNGNGISQIVADVDLFDSDSRGVGLRYNVVALQDDPMKRISWTGLRSSENLGPPEFTVEVEKGEILAAALNPSGRSGFLVDDDEGLVGFQLDRHVPRGALVAAIDLALNNDDPEGQLLPLGDRLWVAVFTGQDGITLKTYDRKGVVSTMTLDGLGAFRVRTIPGRSDSIVVESGIFSPTSFELIRVDTMGLMEEPVQIPNVLRGDGDSVAPGKDVFVVVGPEPEPLSRPGSDTAKLAQVSETAVARVYNYEGELLDQFEVAAGVTDPVAMLTSENELIVAYKRSDAIYGKAFRLKDLPSTCTPDPFTLCMGRYRVTGKYADLEGNRKRAKVFSLTPTTGYFTFEQESNPEIFFKTIQEGCEFPGADPHTWVFAGGLTNLWSEFIIEDVVSGIARIFVNPEKKPYLPIRDTRGLGNCDSVLAAQSSTAGGQSGHLENLDHRFESSQFEPVRGPLTATEPEIFAHCTETDTAVCLNAGRFLVEVDYRTTLTEAQRQGNLIRITSDGAYGWFFSEENVEVFLKVLDACDFTGSFWLFAAGLTDVEVTIRVTDTSTGEQQTYFKALREPFNPILRFRDFKGCGG